MNSYSKRLELLHPIFQNNIYNILNAIKKKLPKGFTCKVISGHRTPSDQFDLYKIGRSFKNGTWIKDARNGRIITNINGITTLSNHNYLPCLSIDIGIFDQDGKYIIDDTFYNYVKEGALVINAEWGGDWSNFKDKPHIELSDKLLFSKNKEREVARQWQLLLKKDGTYFGALDGFFGNVSRSALKKSTGIEIRNIASWGKLVQKIGIGLLSNNS